MAAHLFPDDSPALSREIAHVAACGGQLGFHEMLKDPPHVAKGLLTEHRQLT